jgi:hypothetical protein
MATTFGGVSIYSILGGHFKKNSLLVLFYLFFVDYYTVLPSYRNFLADKPFKLFTVIILCGHFIIGLLVTYFMRATTILPSYRNFLDDKPAMKT